MRLAMRQNDTTWVNLVLMESFVLQTSFCLFLVSFSFIFFSFLVVWVLLTLSKFSERGEPSLGLITLGTRRAQINLLLYVQDKEMPFRTNASVLFVN